MKEIRIAGFQSVQGDTTGEAIKAALSQIKRNAAAETGSEGRKNEVSSTTSHQRIVLQDKQKYRL